MRTKLSLFCFILAVAIVTLAQTANVSTAGLTEMRWRDVGPLRGGRTRANCGVPSQPNVFYIAAVNGGVWKTTDYGRTWLPILDHEPTGSVGAIVVSPSNPNIVYVGSGEGLHRPDLSVGNGIYKSTDAGKTWTHLGLRDGQQIAQMAIDPHNPDRLFVAVAGHRHLRRLSNGRSAGRSRRAPGFVDGPGGTARVLLLDRRRESAHRNIRPPRPPGRGARAGAHLR